MSSECRLNTQGVINNEASPSRYAAITSEGISLWAYRINNEAEETARIPMESIRIGDRYHIVRFELFLSA